MSVTNEKDQFERGIAHFNAGEFFEAHEVWEELWLRAPGNDKPFLQGIIQIAAAFHHFKRGNLRGARTLLTAGLGKIDRYADGHKEIDVAQLCDETKAWLKKLRAGEAPADAQLPKIQKAHQAADE